MLVWSLGGETTASSSSFGGLLRSGTPVWLYEDFKVNRPAGARESAAVLHYCYLCRRRRRGEERSCSHAEILTGIRGLCLGSKRAAQDPRC